MTMRVKLLAPDIFEAIRRLSIKKVKELAVIRPNDDSLQIFATLIYLIF